MKDKNSTVNDIKTVEANAEIVSQSEEIAGRGVFVIDTVPVGVSVRAGFLADDGRLLDLPAVFPDLMYALNQIEELKQLVTQRFAEAAQIGNQVIAQQIQINAANALAEETSEPKKVGAVSTKAAGKR